MGIQKPTKNKAEAFVQPAGGYHPQKAIDPCCIPESVAPLLGKSGGSDSSLGGDTLGHIQEPTRH